MPTQVQVTLEVQRRSKRVLPPENPSEVIPDPPPRNSGDIVPDSRWEGAIILAIGLVWLTLTLTFAHVFVPSQDLELAQSIETVLTKVAIHQLEKDLAPPTNSTKPSNNNENKSAKSATANNAHAKEGSGNASASAKIDLATISKAIDNARTMAKADSSAINSTSKLSAGGLRALFIALQIVGWALIAGGLMKVFSDSILDATKKAVDLMPSFAHQKLASFVVPALLAGTVATGTASRPTPEEAVRTTPAVQSTNLKPLQDEIERLNKSLIDLGSKNIALMETATGLVSRIDCLKKPSLAGCGEEVPLAVNLTDATLKSIYEKTGRLQEKIVTRIGDAEKNMKNDVLAYDRSRIEEATLLRNAFSDLDKKSLKRIDVLEQSSPEEDFSLEKRIDGRFNRQSTAIMQIAARRLIERWSSLTKKEPMLFDEKLLSSKEIIEKANNTLDLLERFRANQSFLGHLGSYFVEHPLETCVALELPQAPEKSCGS